MKFNKTLRFRQNSSFSQNSHISRICQKLNGLIIFGIRKIMVKEAKNTKIITSVDPITLLSLFSSFWSKCRFFSFSLSFLGVKLVCVIAKTRPPNLKFPSEDFSLYYSRLYLFKREQSSSLENQEEETHTVIVAVRSNIEQLFQIELTLFFSSFFI